MKKFLNLLTVAAVGATMSVKTVAAEEVIRAAHAFPNFLVYTKTFLSYVDEVNTRGKGVVRIQVMGVLKQSKCSNSRMQCVMVLLIWCTPWILLWRCSPGD